MYIYFRALILIFTITLRDNPKLFDKKFPLLKAGKDWKTLTILERYRNWTDCFVFLNTLTFPLVYNLTWYAKTTNRDSLTYPVNYCLYICKNIKNRKTKAVEVNSFISMSKLGNWAFANWRPSRGGGGGVTPVKYL